MLKYLYEKYIKENNDNNIKHFKKYILLKYNISIKTKNLYDLIFDIKEHPKCPTCGKKVKFMSFKQGYRVYCSSKCSNSNNDKIMKSNLWYKDKEKVKESRNKSKETIRNKFGCEFYTQTDDFKNKSKETIRNKFGCYNGAQKHIINFSKLNKEFVINKFIKNDKLYAKEFMEYFNLGYDGYKNWIKRLELDHIPIYKGNNQSSGETKWLDMIGVPNDKKHRQVRIYKYIVDGFDPDYNYIYEFCGDFYHGNPDKFNLKDMNMLTHTTFMQLFKKTKEKFDFLTDKGFEVFYTWEDNFNNTKDVVWVTKYNSRDFDDIIKRYI